MPVTQGLIEDVADWASTWLAFRRASVGVPGLQYAIAWRGEVLVSGGDGLSDCQRGVPMSDAQLFRIASHSKTLTATLLMQLSDRDHPALGLDDRVGDHLPELSGRPGLAGIAQCRIGELAHHGSGISRDGIDGDYWQLARPFPDRDALLSLLEVSPSPFGPSERFHYSNLAYSLLGLIIERVSGASFSDLIAERIARPLGLADTAADYLEARAEEYAIGYSHALGGLGRLAIEHIPTNAMAPATGVTSTARDLVRFFSAHCEGDHTLLSEAAKRRMQHEQWQPRSGEGYALGLQTLKVGERRLIGHSGGYPGHITRTWCDPNDQLVVSVLTNATAAPASAWATGIFRLIDSLAQRPGHALSEEIEPRSFAGRFAGLWGAFDIASFDGQLYEVGLEGDDPSAALSELAITGADAAVLAKAPDGYASEGEPYRFERDLDGRVRAVRGESGMRAVALEDWAARVAQGDAIARPDAGAERPAD
ncbi:MAG: serine hydrolase [Actinomycetota bacterium]|nr:serine hydrolase [Actinomycetota bacterium]